MPVGLRPSIRTLTTAITSFGRKCSNVIGGIAKWLNRKVQQKPAERSEIQTGKLSLAEKEKLLEHIKILEPKDKWIQSRTVSKLNDLLTHNQYELLNKAINKYDPVAAKQLYYQIRRQAPGVASMLVGIMTATDTRKKEWAQPFPQPDLINSFKLDNRLHRCAQPGKEALHRLKEEGYHVVNLRHYHSDLTVAGDKEYGGSRFRIPTKTPLPFVVDVLKEVIKHPKVYIHCLHGSDRTGFMCAAYRMVVNGWTLEQAKEEFTKGDFGYHEQFFPELPGMLEKLDVEAIRKEIGLPPLELRDV